MAPKKKRITQDSDLNKILNEGGWKPVPEAELKKYETMAREGHAHRTHGGARAGAGRKPTGHVQATIRLKKETRAFLVKEAGSPRGIGAVIDRLVAQTLGKRPAAIR